MAPAIYPTESVVTRFAHFVSMASLLLCVTRSQDFLLSFGDHVRYTYARTALPIPTPFSARRIGLGRVGDDL
jgi:hypothetical protein